MNWMDVFLSVFRSRQKDISKILDAGGCREGWLQGEFYLHAPLGTLETNATLKKYDLSSTTHPMLAEIKICGGEYHSKMRALIEADVRKLQRAKDAGERYMILLIDTRDADTTLGNWLLAYAIPNSTSREVEGNGFVARIWKLG